MAIHEAMEQQTISVAKAGITTILNSRCSVLAAANPVFGRYDDSLSTVENIDLLPTILSRFDLIFIVRDLRDEKRDMDIARHVVKVHVNASGSDGAGAGAGGNNNENSSDIDIATMKKFIQYARTKCAPTLTASAAAMLANKYAEIRYSNLQREMEARADEREAGGSGSSQGVIPITVRQLEALIRISEAVAKVSLATEANESHVEEALRLFNVSTLTAAASGTGIGEVLSGAMMEKVQRCETHIQKAINVQRSMPTSKLQEMMRKRGYDDATVIHALRIMEMREEVTLVNERKTVRRLK